MFRKAWSMIKGFASGTREVFAEFFIDQPFQLAAALSYYTLLSLAPLLLVITGIAGFVFGEEAVRGELVDQIGGLVGQQGAELIQTVIARTSTPKQGMLATIYGLAILIFGATTVFAQLQAALNHIWHVEAAPERRAVVSLIRARLLSLGLVVALGFLLLVSLVLSAVLAAVNGYLSGLFPGAPLLLRLVNIAITVSAITVIIALIFQVLPDVIISWRDVAVGAAATGVLFTLGKYIIGLYLGQAAVGSAYGAAGSVIVLMVWIYYTSLILFFGAEITEVYARRRGTLLKPAAHARFVRRVPESAQSDHPDTPAS